MRDEDDRHVQEVGRFDPEISERTPNYDEIKVEAWIDDQLTTLGQFAAAPADEGRADAHYNGAKGRATEVWKKVRIKGEEWRTMWHEKLIGSQWATQPDAERAVATDKGR